MHEIFDAAGNSKKEPANYEKTFTKVICRMFGFQDGKFKEHAYFGEGSGPIANIDEWKFHYRCRGKEKTLEVCDEDSILAADGVREHGPCTHKDDVGVICRTGKNRHELTQSPLQK